MTAGRRPVTTVRSGDGRRTGPAPERRAKRTWLITAAVLLAATAGLAAGSDWIRAYPGMMLLLLPATAGWLLVIRWGVPAGGRSNRGLLLLLGVALFGRLGLTLPAAPLSDDLYRYLWDGRVGNAGIDPFRYAPNAAELATLRDENVWSHVNHPDVPTIYPPVAQFFFRALDGLSGDPRVPRLAAALLDVVTVLLLAALLRSRGANPALAVLYAWCPLTFLETGGGGHVDALGVTLLVAALVAWQRRTAVGFLAAGLLLGLSSLVKPVAPLVAPALLWRATRSQRALLLLGAGLSLVTVLPYVEAGERLFAGLRTYAEHWRFNDAVYSGLVTAGGEPRAVRLGLAAATVALAVALPWRVRDPLAAAGTAIGVALVLSPTVHPWYALWLALFLPFLPGVVGRAALVFLALLPVTYVSAWISARGGAWSEPGWMRWVVWGAPGAVLIGDRLRRLVRRPNAA